MGCPSCGGEIAPSHKFCPSCAALVGTPSEMPTRTSPPPSDPVERPLAVDADAPMMSAPVGRVISSGPIPVGGFTPGMVLAGRYRIIGLLGRGGMGEVYRADDLKLGQPVALKFLPKGWGADPVRRERLYAEVRIARQVSHPNVCRVYDVGELAGPALSEQRDGGESKGRHFLTMEYIDGEDLASLLKRIGSLHGAKALDIARQLCAGLAAAHSKGVLHRDLKPANVMLDGRGHVRITDFGLAVAAGDDATTGDISGTPAYMAPEQLAGKGASVRSDIYALGLTLYELYTGRRAFDANSLAELRNQKEGATPTAPSEVARDIEPIVERVILRCMEKDPRQRPGSVMQVAAALPGGDPLAAALAAGETPSPEMVAASGATEGLRPWVAWACLAFIVLGTVTCFWLSRFGGLIERVPVGLAPDVLANKARETLSNVGYSESAVDSASGFKSRAQSTTPQPNEQWFTRWRNPPALAIQFWYRQSPRPLQHWGAGATPSSGVTAGVDAIDPPMLPGESLVWLDSRGHLTGLRAIPMEKAPSSTPARPPDWTVLFKAAGIDPARCTPVAPEWTPLTFADTQAAWTGALPDRPELAMRIEAAAYRGRPVSWRMMVASWEEDDPSTRIFPAVAATAASSQDSANVVWLALSLTIMGGSVVLARRNLRMGRGDRRGAARLAWCSFALSAIAWVFGEHHTLTQAEAVQCTTFIALALMEAGLLWLAYVAIEPFVRRRWPELLVTWNRVLAGNLRDPLVGRDLLVGWIAGTLWALLISLAFVAAAWFGVPKVVPGEGGYMLRTLYLFSGVRATVAGVAGLVRDCIGMGLFSAFFLFLLRLLLRSTWAAAVAFTVVIVAGYVASSGDQSIAYWIYVTLVSVGGTVALVRFGLVASVATSLFANLLMGFPITTELSAWYFGIGLTGLCLLLAMTLYAFHTSLGGRPLFGRAILEE